MKDDDKIVMRDSDEAAKIVTVTGWASRHGKWFGAGEQGESMARYNGCTHVPCEKCGQPVVKSWATCDRCRALAKEEATAEMERQVWDGKTPLYHEGMDRYFFNGVDEECEEAESTFDAMEFRTCEPVYARQIETCDFSDDLPEGDDDRAPDELKEAIEVFNRSMKGVVLCWKPTDIIAVEAKP